MIFPNCFFFFKWTIKNFSEDVLQKHDFNLEGGVVKRRIHFTPI